MINDKEKSVKIGDVFSIGLTDVEGNLLHIHVGSYNFEVILNTAVECIRKIKEANPELADEQMKKISNALINGVKQYEGCYNITAKEGDDVK